MQRIARKESGYCLNVNRKYKCGFIVAMTLHLTCPLVDTSKEPVCPRVELILKIIIIFLGFIKSKPC